MKLETCLYMYVYFFGVAGKLQFASSIFDRMNSSGVAPSIETFNTMIRL